MSVTCDRWRQWFSPGTWVSSTTKTDHHDITEILLQVALKHNNPNPKFSACIYVTHSKSLGNHKTDFSEHGGQMLADGDSREYLDP